MPSSEQATLQELFNAPTAIFEQMAYTLTLLDVSISGLVL